MNETETEEITNRIIAAAKARNYQEVIDLATLGRDFMVVVQRHKEIQQQLKSINENPAPFVPSSYRKCIIEVTRGSLEYSYLLVSGPLKKKILMPSEVLKIHVPATGETFSTKIYLKNKNLNEREAIGRFYKAAAIKVGDLVALTEIAPNEWTLTKSQIMDAEKQQAGLGIAAI